MRGLFAPAIFGIALIAAACNEDTTSPPVASNPAAVSTPAPAPPATAPDAPNTSIVVSGPIIVEHQMDLTAQRDGVVLKLFFDAPARVKAGDLLAQFDDRQLASNLEAARAKSRSIAADLKNWQSEEQVLKADYVRAQRLYDLGLTSEEQLQHAKYKADSDHWDIERITETLNTARHEEHSLEIELEKSKVTAPFTGLIARRYIRDGQNVAKGDRLFWVTAESPLLLRFTLPEKYFGKLRPGKELEVTSADVPGEKCTARVKQISPVIDPSSGTFEVLVELTTSHTGLRPGMNASARMDMP